ncbi:hypothetical protein HK104_001488 [Borealophlyctis nickersoniae]|nr:hypothetical protein HK104_001488 [Borealophlyctis nickersoniae]
MESRRGGKGKAKGGKDKDRERKERELEKKERERLKREEQELKRKAKAPEKPKDILIPDAVSVANLSNLLGVTVDKLARKMSHLGFENTAPEYVLNSENASLIVLEYNMNPIVATNSWIDLTPRPEPEDWSQYLLRPPVVTIMGHVDHGKTTLLDSLRKTSVAAGEAGGITQHIVVLPSQKRITFLDTPGHAAFSAMRERGAQTTDIVVLVVAADDGVMPQTLEAFKHATAANVPIIVAINKCDKRGVDISAVKQGLLQNGIILEEFGGDIPAVEVSGLTGKGLDDLEENILAVAEVLDMRGDPEGLVEGVVIEAKLAKGRGNVATLLIKRGTLRTGAFIVAGNAYCKVRSMYDENLNVLAEAGPSQPVEVMGWKDIPGAGDSVLEAESEDIARRVVQGRIEKAKREESAQSIDRLNEKRLAQKLESSERRAIRQEFRGKEGRRRLAEFEAAAEQEEVSEDRVLNLILKADVQGSLEAVSDALYALPAHEARLHIVDSGVGPVTESDLKMAEATNSTILSFNVPTDKRTAKLAEEVKICQHNIIYNLLDDVKEMLSDLLPPEIVKEVKGEAEVLQVFQISVKKGTETVAGCKVLTGKILKSHKIRIVRDGETVHEDGTLKTFKQHKKNITEIVKGQECGMGFEGFSEFREGDIIQAYTITEVKRKIA